MALVHSPKPTLQARCAAIELLVVDVDGVLTDGGIVLGSGGLELKQFHVRDGSGLKLWHQAGRRTALISGRSSVAVEARAKELGIGWVFQGAAEKLPAFRLALSMAAVGPEAVCCVGDDLPDLPALQLCGLAVAVADACAEVGAQAQYVTQAPGGRGAVREVIELILRAQGAWAPLLERLGSARI
jgi:3-deoxy-D-manno-octulosonate 8-phosphate phosphatase (KDO 8-P phosphatase)